MALPDIYNNGTYLANKPTWDINGAIWKAQKIFEFMTKNQMSPQSISEVGCGSGQILKTLQELMPDNTSFVGYDISKQTIQKAQEQQNPHLKYEVKDIDSVTQKSDMLLLIDVVEHIEDYFHFLAEAKKLAEYKLLYIPLEMTIQSLLRGSKPFIDSRKGSGHLHFFTKETALLALTDLGYDILDFAYAPACFALPRATKLAAMANIPRRILYPFAPDFTVKLLGGWSLFVLAK